MQKKLYYKIFVISIICLFIGMNISLATTSRLEEKHQFKDKKLIRPYNIDIDYWALIVGVGVYAEHPWKTIPSIPDAERMHTTLISNEHWKDDHIKVITGENATKNNILKGFQWLDNMEDENDISVIYISTHGGQMTFFGIPIDFPPIDEWDRCDEVLTTYYSFVKPFLNNLRDDELSYLINRLESKAICVIIESCHSGGFNDTSRSTLFRNKILPMSYVYRDFLSAPFIKDFSEEIRKEGRVILMSSQEDESSYATEDGAFFTNLLIKSLREDFGDFNNNGYISAEEAFNYTMRRIASKSRYQHPTIYDDYDGDLDLTVSRYKIDFFDDCETIEGWSTIDHTVEVSGDLWHLSKIGYISPTYCWYHGNENTMCYNNNMNNSLVSLEIKLGTNPLLTFYGKAETECYDSLWLDISTDNWQSYYSRKILLYHYWTQKEEYLKDFNGGPIQIRFRVISDENIPFNPHSSKGFFMIDDILIFSERMMK